MICLMIGVLLRVSRCFVIGMGESEDRQREKYAILYAPQKAMSSFHPTVLK